MGVAEFIEERFLNKEICIFIDTTAETILYDQSWSNSKEYFRGIVKEVNNSIIILHIEDNGIIYIPSDKIVTFWEPPLDYHKAVFSSLTNRIQGAKRKYK